MKYSIAAVLLFYAAGFSGDVQVGSADFEALTPFCH